MEGKMPKIIENLNDRILDVAEARLKKDGYEKLTVRGIATDCDIAIGTMYNYYSSKEMLVGSLIFRDWRSVMVQMELCARRAVSVHEGIASISNLMTEFAGRFSPIWKDYHFSKSSSFSFEDRHMVLVQELSQTLCKLFTRFTCKDSDKLSQIFAEVILDITSSKKSYEEYSDILERMIEKQ